MLIPYSPVKFQVFVIILKIYNENVYLGFSCSEFFASNNTKTFTLLSIRIWSIGTSDFPFTLVGFGSYYTGITQPVMLISSHWSTCVICIFVSKCFEVFYQSYNNAMTTTLKQKQKPDLVINISLSFFV